MGHIDVQHVTYGLPDGRVLLDDVSFRVPDGSTAALVGANGAGKTTLMRMMAGDIRPHEGSIVCSGTVAVMRQFIGQMSEGTVRDLLFGVSPAPLRDAARELDAAELALMESDDEPTQMQYAHAIADYSDAGGYDAEVLFDVVTMAAMGEPYERMRWRPVSTLSGGEQKRLVLELLLRGNADILLLDEPDNYLDVPGKTWLEQQLRETPKTVLLISHDRELLNQCASHVVAVELGAVGNTAWVHGGGFASFHEARADRFSRLEELRRRWDEEHVKLKELVQSLKVKAKFNDGMASRYQAAQTRLRKFEEAGSAHRGAQGAERPDAADRRSHRQARRGVRGTGADRPDAAVRRRGVVRRAARGARGQRLRQVPPAAAARPRRQSTPTSSTSRWATSRSPRCGTPAAPGWAHGCGRAGSPRRTCGRTCPDARCWTSCIAGTSGAPGCRASRRPGCSTATSCAAASEQDFDTLSGGQQARFQILLLELSGATMLLLDEPTDNLDLASAEALEVGLNGFEGTVVAVTHDRWFTRGFDRFWVFRADGRVEETPEPVWEAW